MILEDENVVKPTMRSSVMRERWSRALRAKSGLSMSWRGRNPARRGLGSLALPAAVDRRSDPGGAESSRSLRSRGLLRLIRVCRAVTSLETLVPCDN
jgi:hypothetical protein